MHLCTSIAQKLRHLAVVAVVCGLSLSANAGVVPLGNSGWQAVFDAGLDPFVTITVNSETSQAVFIRKAATFTQGPVNTVFPPIDIVFMQTSANAVPFIVIDDEILTNQTGTTWGDFHFDVFGGLAKFDVARTAASGGPAPIGFSVAPYTTAQFANGDTTLDMFGGPGIPNGGVWTPGAEPSGGQLWIDGNPATSGPFRVFTLKERPTIPEPASLGVLAFGALLIIRRRRS
jgi:hypothetical protein